MADRGRGGLVLLAAILLGVGVLAFKKRASIAAATVGFLKRGSKTYRVLKAVNVPAGGLVSEP